MEKLSVAMIKARYLPGMQIRLIEMDDKQAPPAGTLGTVTCVDDVGTVHMKWENGSSLGLIPNVDRFQVIGMADYA